MAKQSWTDMIEMYPTGHLVVGDVIGGTSMASSRLVSKLLRGCGVEGDYSLTTVKEANGPVIHCVFAEKADADQFSEAVGARPVGKYSGWASQRAFFIDEGTRSAISDVFEAAPL